MIYTVSITGGRRMTIPIKLRRELGWDKKMKVSLKREQGKIILFDQKLAKLI